MVDILKEKIVKIRKNQLCWGCGSNFKKGDKLKYVKSVDRGVFEGVYWCKVCSQTLKENKREHPEYETEGYPYLIVKEFDSWEENNNKYDKTFII